MLSKLLITVMTAVLLAVVCFPVQAHNGHLSVRIEPDTDEQPWGGDSHFSGSDQPSYVGLSPDFFQGTYFFVAITLDYGWFTITEYIMDSFSTKDTKTFTTPAVPLGGDTSTETQRSEPGAGNE